MNLDRKKLIGIITEIEASRARAKAETTHQSEILKKAKADNFDTKAIRKVLQRRAMSASDRDSLDYAVDLYETAMGTLAKALEAVEEGRMSQREAAKHFDVPRGALGAVAGGPKTGFSSHDADTGEITENGSIPLAEQGEGDDDDSSGDALGRGTEIHGGNAVQSGGAGRGSVRLQPVEQPRGDDDQGAARGSDPEDEEHPEPAGCDGGAEAVRGHRDHGTGRDADAGSEGAVREGVAPTANADGMDIPDRLRRSA